MHSLLQEVVLLQVSGGAGAIVALVLGLTGMVLGGMTLARLRRITTGSNTP